MIRTQLLLVHCAVRLQWRFDWIRLAREASEEFCAGCTLPATPGLISH
jgi:hypothetical protein